MPTAANGQTIQLPGGIELTPDIIKGLVFGDRNDRMITGEEVQFHEHPHMIFPKQMTYGRAIEILEQKREDEEKITAFSRRFNYRPNDGAVAAANVMKRRWGMALGRTMRSFFGNKPPELRTVAIGPSKKVQVPWGLVEIPALDGLQINLGEDHHPDFGSIFWVMAQGPNRYRREMDEFFTDLDKELATNSIYRGHPLLGADSLEFLDLSGFDPTKIVFSDEVNDTLENALWATLRHTDALIMEDIAIKRALLLHGLYGTGKSSIGQITAQVAETCGRTTIISKPGDDVRDVLRTARLYPPAVVFIEDIDTQARSGKPQDVAQLLDAFDGIAAKDSQIVMVLTTNHADKIHQGMLRPGRLDYTVELGYLDRNGIERLIKVIVPAHKLGDIDYDAVYAEMENFGPAFAKSVADRAKTWALNRNDGQPDYVLQTPDLVGAARSLHPQLALLNDAGQGEVPPTMDSVFTSAIESGVKVVLEKSRFYDADDDEQYGPHHMRVEEKQPRR